MPKNEWGTSSGFKSGYELRVVDSFFTPSQFGWQLVWNGYDLDEPEEEIQAAVRLNVGANWESLDGGETIEHSKGNTLKNGEPRKIIGSTAYGKVIEIFIRDNEDESLYEEFSPFGAETWIGSVWYIGEEAWTLKDKNTGEEKSGKKVVPLNFLGFGEQTKQQDLHLPTADQLNTVHEKLKAIAAESTTHEDFMDAVLSLPDLASNASVVSSLADPELYESLRAE